MEEEEEDVAVSGRGSDMLAWLVLNGETSEELPAVRFVGCVVVSARRFWTACLVDFQGPGWN